MIYTIYKATNIINNKIYIGFTKDYNERIKSHIRISKSKTNSLKFAFHNAITKYNIQNFTWEILYQSKDKNYTLNIMEPHFILEYKSLISENGYNMTLGGGNCIPIERSPLTLEQKNNISIGTISGMCCPILRKYLSDIGKNNMNKPENKLKNREKSLGNTYRLGKKSSEYTKELNSIRSKEMWENPEIRIKLLIHIQNPTPETRRKMSESALGRIPWNKGKKHKPESIEKMRLAHKGVVLTQEHKDKISKSNTGKKKPPMSDKQKKQLSDDRKGIPLSKDHCINISKGWDKKPMLKCPHCSLKSRSNPNMVRYHFDNCKSLKVESNG